MKLRFIVQAVALVLLPICLGVYVQYNAQLWWQSAPLGRLAYEYYMIGAIALFAFDIAVIDLIFELIYRQW